MTHRNKVEESARVGLTCLQLAQVPRDFGKGSANKSAPHLCHIRPEFCINHLIYTSPASLDSSWIGGKPIFESGRSLGTCAAPLSLLCPAPPPVFRKGAKSLHAHLGGRSKTARPQPTQVKTRCPHPHRRALPKSSCQVLQPLSAYVFMSIQSRARATEGNTGPKKV